MYCYFKVIVEEMFFFVMFYNVLGRMVVLFVLEMVIRFVEILNIFVIKEVSGDFDVIMKIIVEMLEDFYVYLGDDGLMFFIFVVGGRGVVLVVSYIVGFDMQ